MKRRYDSTERWPAETLRCSRSVQPEKALGRIEVIPSGRVMEEREEQPEKASPPIEVIPSGRVMEERDEQPWKANASIEVIPWPPPGPAGRAPGPRVAKSNAVRGADRGSQATTGGGPNWARKDGAASAGGANAGGERPVFLDQPGGDVLESRLVAVRVEAGGLLGAALRQEGVAGGLVCDYGADRGLLLGLVREPALDGDEAGVGREGPESESLVAMPLGAGVALGADRGDGGDDGGPLGGLLREPGQDGLEAGVVVRDDEAHRLLGAAAGNGEVARGHGGSCGGSGVLLASPGRDVLEARFVAVRARGGRPSASTAPRQAGAARRTCGRRRRPTAPEPGGLVLEPLGGAGVRLGEAEFAAPRRGTA